MSDTSHADLVENCKRQAAEQKQWDDHFARRTPRQTCCDVFGDCNQGRNCPQRRPKPDGVYITAILLQYLAIVAFIACLLLAIF